MKSVPRWLSWVLLSVLALGLAALPSGAQQNSLGVVLEGEPTIKGRSSVPPPALVAGGPAPDLEILYSSEVRGFYQPCG